MVNVVYEIIVVVLALVVREKNVVEIAFGVVNETIDFVKIIDKNRVSVAVLLKIYVTVIN